MDDKTKDLQERAIRDTLADVDDLVEQTMAALSPEMIGTLFLATDAAITEDIAQQCVKSLLRFIGEDPDRDGLIDTPKRVVKALKEMTSGVNELPEEILSKQFALQHDEMVVLRNIPFTSLCEHHMLPFSGYAGVAYIPKPYNPLTKIGGYVVGLSKLARLVQCYAKRLQVQERMTSEIADALVKYLHPQGAACVIVAQHSCLSCRGARISGSEFITSAMRGCFASDMSARLELLSLLK